MIVDGLFEELRTNAGVQAFVDGAGTEPDRIYPGVIPQKMFGRQQLNAIVYTVNSVQRGASYCATDRVIRTTITIDNYSKSYLTAHALADATQAALLDFRGTLGGICDVRDAKLTNEFDLLDIEPGLYRVSQSWDFWHLDD